VPRIKIVDVGEAGIELADTAAPSALTIGVHPGSLLDIDPSVPPETTHDCIAAEPCPLTMADDPATVPLKPLLGDDQGPAVFVVTAGYFAESAGTPFANTLAWVFEFTQ
jgi:hypothetical protein